MVEGRRPDSWHVESLYCTSLLQLSVHRQAGARIDEIRCIAPSPLVRLSGLRIDRNLMLLQTVGECWCCYCAANEIRRLQTPDLSSSDNGWAVLAEGDERGKKKKKRTETERETDGKETKR
jgi:hypothetical protein